MSEEIYIGTKVIAAEPMDEEAFAYFQKHGWEHNRPARLGYKVRYEDGYISWSPKETFERAYRRVTQAEMKLIGEDMGVHMGRVFSKNEMPTDQGKEG